MKVLIVATNFAPELTGSGLYTGELAHWLAKQGHNVTAIVGPPHYPEWEVPAEYKKKPFRVERLSNLTVLRVPMYIPPSSKTSSARRILMETSFTFAAMRWVVPQIFAAKPFDVAVAICPPMQSATLTMLMRLARGTPWVFHIQDLQVDAATNLGMIDNRLLISILRRIEKFILKRATYVSTITEAMRARIVSKGIDVSKTGVIPNWSDTARFAPAASDPILREEMGAGPDDILFLYSGNLGEKQGLEVLVEAAHQVRSDTRLRFAIAGQGAAKSRLQEQALALGLTNLVFLPLYPKAVFAGVLNSADVHLVIQRSDAADTVMPSKLTNILSVGKPAIATATNGTTLHDVITENNTGLVVEPEKAAALARAIRGLATDAEQRTEMGINARQYALDHLAEEAILPHFEQVLMELANTR